MLDSPVILVFFAALLTALATGLGAIPLIWARSVGRVWLGVGNAIAAGLMLAASFSLVEEGFGYDPVRTLAGVAVGLAGIMAAKYFLDSGGGENAIADVQGADAIKIFLIIGVMTVHSAAEGIAVGVGYGGGRELGDFLTVAIALHNVPEGLAISLVMVPRGAGVLKAAWWSIFSSLPQPLLAVPAFLFVLTFQPFLPVGLGLAAGAMIWMIFAELMPDATRDASPETAGAVVTFSFAVMMGVTLLL
ncbi:ZIP family metal transporter [Rhodobacteraceae bacterium WD3A24]|nr:ZIP family metal transporter [Rhodobacteraceae bacterium WD3A24]